MPYDLNQSKAELETGQVVFPAWLPLYNEKIDFEDNNFSYADWKMQQSDSILTDWTLGTQFEPMLPQVGSGGGDTSGAYNNGFNNGFVVGMRLKKK